MRRVILFASITLTLIAAIVAGLSLRPVRIRIYSAEMAPLAAHISVSTRMPTRVTVTLRGRRDDDLTVQGGPPATSHAVALLGLYPDHRNQVTVRAEAGDRVYERRRVIRTAALPAYYPEVEIERHEPDRIAPGMIFMILAHYDEDGSSLPLPSAVDNHGHVRWYYAGDVGHVMRRMENGNLLIAQGDSLVEMDMLGRPTGREWPVPGGFHHDAVILPDGNLLALTAAPGSFDDGLVEIDGASGRVVREWDFREILDPGRPRQPVNLEERDWLHLNAVEYDPHSGGIIVSGRDQSAVASMDRESSALRWILGNHEHWTQAFTLFLLQRVGSPFHWQWGQHAPMVHPEVPNRILVYDNGNKRSYDAPLEAAENYSRAVEYHVDPETMEVRQLWEYGRRYGSELYTPFIGDADYLPNGNRLVTFGGITRTLDGEPSELFDYEQNAVRRMKVSARIVEVSAETPAREIMTITLRDPDPASYRGYRVYRAVKMPLYP